MSPLDAATWRAPCVGLQPSCPAQNAAPPTDRDFLSQTLCGDATRRHAWGLMVPKSLGGQELACADR